MAAGRAAQERRMRYARARLACGAGEMRGWLLYLGLGLLTYWLFFGQPDWASLVLWLLILFWPFVLVWEIGWWLVKAALAVGLALFLVAVAYDVWQRRRTSRT
jgi:cell division protein FtsW (lipid II flippase)